MNHDRNEAETRADLIDPALREEGWGVVEGSRIRRELIAPGRLIGAGKRSDPKYADYVLVYRNQKLAVIEAKAEDKEDTEGLGQAKDYAEILDTPFTYSTNGHGIYQVDMETGEEGYINAYPTPDELWETVYGREVSREQYWRDRFTSIPFNDKGGQWQPRYYQHIAVNKAMEAISQGKDRILLTLATGTGKTAIAFQIAWKLFHSRWNNPDWRNGVSEGVEPGRLPRILFLADRNILADQAFNAFSSFPEDALVRIDPDIIRKKGKVPKNGSVFFTIFQTFMTGQDREGNPKPNFGDYSPDFFDFIVIDECHRGGANDESTWRYIMDHFKSAVQLGLTATPKREINADTYNYFGEPVYVYSLKEGINDGFLSPFKVRQITTTMDTYVYSDDDEVIEGEVEAGRVYTEHDINRIIEIEGRERKRVRIFMDEIDQREKTLVFCATQDHALAVRNLINQMKNSTDPNYCVRVTANDGALGEQHLRTFQDNEKTIPTILTTSRKLSTGVDARNVRNIVLMRPINSMIEFKQIIGRGTRLFEGKDYFTIYDFVRAYKHFNDPDWDGEPVEPPDTPPHPPRGPYVYPPPEGGEEPPRRRKTRIKLADGKERTIQHTIHSSFWGPDGKPMSAAEFIENLFGHLPELFQNAEELRTLWSNPETRKRLLEGLKEKGYGKSQLHEVRELIDAERSDLFDVLAYIAFANDPISREDRVNTNKSFIFSHYSSKEREFLDFVLDHYIRQGVGELDTEKLPHLLELKYSAFSDALILLCLLFTILANSHDFYMI